MEIQKTSDITPNKINALIFGEAGTGKTTLAATLPGSTVIVSLESGLLSLRGFDIDYVDVKNLPDLRAALKSLVESDYDNIFIDSLTSISELFFANSKLKYPDDSHTMKLYGHLLESMTHFIKYARDIDKNIFFTALQKNTIDEVGRRFYCPDMQGSISTKCTAFFDFVFNYQIIETNNESKRVLITGKTSNSISKDRSGKLDLYEEPNLTNIINKVFI